MALICDGRAHYNSQPENSRGEINWIKKFARSEFINSRPTILLLISRFSFLFSLSLSRSSRQYGLVQSKLSLFLSRSRLVHFGGASPRLYLLFRSQTRLYPRDARESRKYSAISLMRLLFRKKSLIVMLLQLE